jgi:hypothetical protein
MTDERRPDIDDLISLVELPGPLPDGVEDALWESTAELFERQVSASKLYEQRISASKHESETEIILLSPERSDRAPRRRTWLSAAAAALVVVLAIGLAFVPRSDDREDPVTTQVPPPTAPPTAPPTVPAPEYLGIVWESAVDPERVNMIEGQPELVDGPLSARVDMFVITPGPDESPFCADAVENATGPDGNPLDLPEVTSCLIVEWQFDVGEEAVNNAGMDAREAVTADGLAVPPLNLDFPGAPPGGSDSGSVVFPNLGPGSRISVGYEVNLADGGIIFERWEVVVPDTFQPIGWFEDES